MPAYLTVNSFFLYSLKDMNWRRDKMNKPAFKFFIVFLLIISISYFVPDILSGKDTSKTSSEGLTISSIMPNIPLYFIPNKGQFKEEALYYAKAQNYTIWLTKNELVFDSVINLRVQTKSSKHLETEYNSNEPSELKKIKRNVSRLLFIGANNNPEVTALDQTKHRVNYLTGKDTNGWKTDIPTSGAVLYRELYPYIDLKIYGTEKKLEYDFIVKPGGNISDINLKYTDVKNSRIRQEGSLEIETEFGTLIHSQPDCYQIIKGNKVDVQTRFIKTGKNTFAFESASYDQNVDLIIDPLVEVNSTFIGGSDDDAASGVVLDKSGMAYITGGTYSPDFPTKIPFQQDSSGDADIFVMKVNPYDCTIFFSTYLGGSEGDYAMDIAIDKKNEIYLTGFTKSDDFPIKDAFQQKHDGSSDAFLTKLSTYGQRIIYSTFIGGEENDEGVKIAVDSKRQAYLVGWTGSEKFPTKKAFQKKHAGISDNFVTKFNKTGKRLKFSTFIGGSDREYPCGLVLHPDQSIWIAGDTESHDYPIKNAFQKKHIGEQDIVVTKLSSTGGLLYSTYFGGSGVEYGHDIAVSDKGMVYISGSTRSNDLPLKKPIKNKIDGESDIIVAAFRSKGKLFRSTYLGGSGWETTGSIAADKQGRIFVSGSTESPDFPEDKSTGIGHDSYTPEYAYFLVLNTRLNKILYTYLDPEHPFLWPDSMAFHYDSSGKLMFLFVAGSIYYEEAPKNQEDIYLGRFKIQ